jgi:hypothetical protein
VSLILTFFRAAILLDFVVKIEAEYGTKRQGLHWITYAARHNLDSQAHLEDTVDPVTSDYTEFSCGFLKIRSYSPDSYAPNCGKIADSRFALSDSSGIRKIRR